MADIVMADHGIAFDGTTPETRPLGGAESAYVALAQALAARGHRVQAFASGAQEIEHLGVAWTPLEKGLPNAAELYIANRSDRLLNAVPKAKKRVFWIHNPARYLNKWRYLHKLFYRRPVIVFSGAYHASTLSRLVPHGGTAVIPYGIPDAFRTGRERPPPGPFVLFASNPERGLDWLLDRWQNAIGPAVPAARLDIYAGSATYGTHGAARAGRSEVVLSRAETIHGVRRFDPVPKPALIERLLTARLLLYRGDPNETYCYAVAEAQALGVPAVSLDLGSLQERIRHDETGFIATSDKDFEDRAIALLTDDALWNRMHKTALARQADWSWDKAAAEFEAFLP